MIVVNVNDGIWPIKYAQEKEQYEQERRLFYVTMTRARKKLIFLVVDNILGYRTQASPFLGELGIGY